MLILKNSIIIINTIKLLNNLSSKFNTIDHLILNDIIYPENL